MIVPDPMDHSKPRRTSLRAWPLWTKVSALLLLASVLPLLLSSAHILREERAEARAANVALLEARVDEIGHTLEAMVRGYRDAAVRTARDPDVIAFCRGSVEARARAIPALQERLDVFRGEDSAIRGLGLVDLNGTVIAATETQLRGANISYRNYFRSARQGAEGISDVFVSLPLTGRTPTVAVAVPVRSRSGEVVGVSMLWLRAKALWDVMRAANGTGGRGSYFILFDRLGFRVGHSASEELLYHPAAALTEQDARAVLADRRFQERTAELVNTVVPYPLHEIRGREHRVLRRHASPANQVDNLAVARTFPALPWTLVGHIPESEVDVGVASLLPKVVPALLVGLAFALVAGALLMRHVVCPIRRVAAAAAALERGELALCEDGKVPADVDRRDEVGGLARSFRSMASSLADRERNLRERNRDLERRQRALLMLSECSEALVRASDEQSLLDAVCSSIVRVGGYRLCWIGFAEHDEHETVVPAARAGQDHGHLSEETAWAERERGAGPVGTAIRTARSAIVNRNASDPALEEWRRDAVERGFRSVAALPIVSDGGAILGAVGIYAAEEDAFDEEETSLLRRLADGVAYGVIALRGRGERLRMAGQLLQADRMVAVGTLAAGVAHEINNPLSYVVAGLQFVQDELGSLVQEFPAGRLQSVQEALSDAREGAGRVTTIVRDLKTFSRADEERRGPVELHPVIDSSINMAFNEIKHRARLIKDYGSIPPALANEARLGQVFLNLLVNAAQAIPEGNADSNEIRVATRTDPSGRAVIEVSDTGTGIAPEVVRHVFDPFFTTKPVGVGTGLGLFICRNIVTAVGGEIAAESRPRRGTVFRVTLPAAPYPQEDGEESGSSPGHVARRRRGRVLVVDDEPAVGGALRRLLQAEHDVVVLTSAGEARDRIVGGDRYDIILCDLMMPTMTGMDLHAELTALDPAQAARMILLTGGAFTPNARRFIEACPNRCLEKPLDSAELRALVWTFVSQDQVSAS
jgi:C4-dicarboxylate-specific signal transduction histidine kinase/CheY-like chemotaxis protein